MKRNQLKAGVVISMLDLLLGNLIPFIYTPIMLRILGQAEYGLYGIAQSVMGYLRLLNFGIGGAIVRYIAKYRAEGDTEKEEAVIGLFIKLYSFIATMIFITGMTVSFHMSVFSRSMSNEEIHKLAVLVRLMTVNMSIFMPFSVFSAITVAHERFIFSRLISVGCTVVVPVINILMLFAGRGSVGLVVTSTIVNFCAHSLYLAYSIKVLKIRPRFGYKLPGLVQEIIGFSFYVFVASIVDTLYWATDKLIIGWAIGTVATAVYNVGATFNSYVTSLSTAVSGVLSPKLTAMAVKGASGEEFTEIFVKIGRLQFIIISFIVSAFIGFGRQFIVLWAGENYGAAYYVALLVMIPVTVPLIQNTGINILYAMNKHKFRALVYLAIAILNIGMTFWWVEIYGIIGAAMATCIAYILGNIIIMNLYYWRKIGINIPLFWLTILKMSPTMLVMTLLGYYSVEKLFTNSWSSFLMLAVGYTVVYALLSYIFMMNTYERNLIMDPLKRIVGKMKP